VVADVAGVPSGGREGRLRGGGGGKQGNSEWAKGSERERAGEREREEREGERAEGGREGGGGRLDGWEAVDGERKQGTSGCIATLKAALQERGREGGRASKRERERGRGNRGPQAALPLEVSASAPREAVTPLPYQGAKRVQ
jgi:hypothetical protein